MFTNKYNQYLYHVVIIQHSVAPLSIKDTIKTMFQDGYYTTRHMILLCTKPLLIHGVIQYCSKKIGFVYFLIFYVVKTWSENFKWHVIKTLIYQRYNSKNLVAKFPLQVTLTDP